MIDVKKILEEEGQVRKLEGNAPEGFILVHEKTLEDLKDFDTWKSWKHNEITIKEMNKKNFENE
jgi:class 3 adenylate cyclase